MTDSIFITGAGDGAFAKAFDGLPPWATEDTLLDIKKLIDKSNQISVQTLTALAKGLGGAGGAGSGLSDSDIKKINEELGKMGENLIDVDKEHSKEKKRWKDTEDNFKKRQGNWKAAALSAASMLGVVTSLSAGFTKIINTYSDGINTFDKLHEAGVNMVGGMDGASNGLQSLQQLTAITGVRYTELAKTMSKFSVSVNSVGVAKFAKTMAGASNTLRQYGFTTQEAGDLLGTYIDTQRGFADASGRTQEELQKDLVGFGKRINDVSLATGQSKEAILKNLAAVSQSTEAMLLNGQVGTQAAEATLEFIASMKDQKLGKDILDMMTSAFLPLNHTFSALQKSGNGAFAQREAAFFKSLEGMDAEKRQAATAAWVKQSDAELETMMQRNNLLAASGNAEAKTANDHIAALRKQAKEYNAMSDEDRKKIAMTAASTKRMKNALERFEAAFQMLFTPLIPIIDLFSSLLESVNYVIANTSDVLNDIGSVFEWVGSKFSQFGKWISSFFPTFEKTNTVVSAFGSGISAILGKFTGLLGVLALFGAGMVLAAKYIPGVANLLKHIGNSKMVGALADRAGKGTGGLYDKIAGKIGGSDSADTPGKGSKKGKNNAGAGISKGLTNIGKGIGSFLGSVGKGAGEAISGILSGLASGLSALGKPQVLVGTLALIGVGAAMWVSAKAFKEFSGIEWDQVAVGALALGVLAGAAALLAPVAPLIIAGALAIGVLGAAAWVAGKGLQSMGDGAKAFSEGIVTLSTLDPVKLFKASLGITALSGALIAFGGAMIGGGVGAALGNTMTKIFGGGTLLEQISAFAALATPLSTTASALTSITSGMSALSASVNGFDIDALAEIINTVNEIDLLKAAAFAMIGSVMPANGKVTTSPGAAPSTAVADPTTPALSTINSPSSVDTVNPEGAKAEVKDAPSATPDGIKQPSGDSGISNAIAFQSTLLEQILLGTNNMVSVSRDLLKYTKAQA